jgi:hypothetical protein
MAVFLQHLPPSRVAFNKQACRCALTGIGEFDSAILFSSALPPNLFLLPCRVRKQPCFHVVGIHELDRVVGVPSDTPYAHSKNRRKMQSRHSAGENADKVGFITSTHVKKCICTGMHTHTHTHLAAVKACGSSSSPRPPLKPSRNPPPPSSAPWSLPSMKTSPRVSHARCHDRAPLVVAGRLPCERAAFAMQSWMGWHRHHATPAAATHHTTRCERICRARTVVSRLVASMATASPPATPGRTTTAQCTLSDRPLCTEFPIQRKWNVANEFCLYTPSLPPSFFIRALPTNKWV